MKKRIGLSLFYALFSLFVVVCAFETGASAAAAKEMKEAFVRANELSIKGDFQKAIEIYQRLLARYPNDPDILYNAGTTAPQGGRIGYAVLYLERALLLSPDCDDCRYNLERAKKQQKDRVIVEAGKNPEKRAISEELFASINTTMILIAFLVFHVGFVVVFFLRRFSASERLRFSLMLFATVLLFLAILTGGLAAYKVFSVEEARYGVVLQETLSVKKGPNRNYPEDFIIHEGLKVRLGEQVEDWRRIWLTNGLNGYVEEKTIGKIDERD